MAAPIAMPLEGHYAKAPSIEASSLPERPCPDTTRSRQSDSVISESSDSDAGMAHLSTSSSDSRTLDFYDRIPEEDESYDTGSEAIEPMTPTSDTHSHEHDDSHDGLAILPTGVTDPVKSAQTIKEQPFVIPNAVTPPQSRTYASSPENVSIPSTAASPSQHSTPTAKRSTSNRIRSLFRRTTSYGRPTHSDLGARDIPSFDIKPPSRDADHPPLRKLPSFAMLGRASPKSSKTNTPPSPGSPGSPASPDAPSVFLDDGQQSTSSAPDSSEPAQGHLPRAATGLEQRRGRIAFTDSLQPPGAVRKRSTSMNGVPFVTNDNSISMPAATGAGLKARRLSTSLPEDFTINVVELSTEFASTSIVPGRRGRLVGTGATANVKLMARKGSATDEIYAVKEFRKKGKQEDEHEYVKKVKSEFSIAKSLHHPNIVATVRLCTHSGRWNHVMEYCAQGELFSLVQKGYMEEVDRLCFLKQLLRGVAYLHGVGIAHRDIKLENLLITNDGHLKITDFGVSEVFCGEHPGLRAAGGECGKNMKETRRCAPGICGSLPYIAPEVLEKNGDYDPRPLDVWSCAIVYMTMKFGGSPWPAAETSYVQYGKFVKGWESFFKKHAEQLITDETGTPKCGELFAYLDSQAMRRLLLRMLHPVPEKRISIHDAVNDRWVKTIDCCSPQDYNHVETPGCIDAAGKKSCRLLAKSGIKKLHHHLPPAKRRDALHPTF
ncbi:MAG: hypothetical protein M1817_000868 [Caeruleum heppii]|nr:MAG: hypothetical protein M1817_000868 [Caeruleum heppii]